MWNDPKYTKEQRVAKLVKIEMGGGYVDISKLAGPARASNRASLMSEINGFKTPQSKSGVNAITDALFKMYEITGDCSAIREKNLANAIESNSGGATS